MDYHKEYNRELKYWIKRFSLIEEEIESHECNICGGIVDYYATKKERVTKLRACYNCGVQSIQTIN